ncbi:MAG: penicillin acylase family protein, partial [Actinomycetales bacterium]
PTTAGEITVDVIDDPVTVIRNDLGIPAIYVSSLEDLFFAQGYVHAQDRFWEMDVRRHITAGRLSEMFGPSQVPTDAFIRTLGWERIAEQELAQLSDRSRQILTAYAAGVNAYLIGRSGRELSLEYSVLALQNPDYRPEPWQPVHSVAWLKALAWDLRGNMEDEIYRSVMSASVGVDQTEELFPPYPFDRHQPIVTQGTVVAGVFDQDAGATGVVAGPRVAASAGLVAAMARVRAGVQGLEDWLAPVGEGIGSNSWAVSGAHTASGKPLLANDPHLAPAMPSLWYQSGLHCIPATDEAAESGSCNYDVSGWTMAGLPGVFIGHNDRIAWGFTNMGPDVTDLVLHQVTGSTYLLDGAQVPLEEREEVIEVAGGSPVTITVRSTVDGPIISDVADIDTYAAVGADAPVPAPGAMATKEVQPPRGDGYAVALRWTALQPAPTFDAFDLLNTAQNWDDFREAATKLAVPAQNLLYADVDGHIGYQSPGVIPIRVGYDGKWPIPGWYSRYHWQGTIPFTALPSVFDPPQGWIVTANQAVIGPGYPFFLTDDWAYGSRSQRIIDRVEEVIDSGQKFTPDTMRTIQMDSWNELAAFLAPQLATLEPPATLTEPKQIEQFQQAQQLLAEWDFTQPLQAGTTGAAAAVFNATWSQMVARMFDAASDTEIIKASGGDRYWQVIRNIWDDPVNPWWDDRTEPGIQDRDATLQVSLAAAINELQELQGSDPTAWSWGDLHQLELVNQTLGSSGIAPIEWLFNRGPYATAGGESIVNATGWTPLNGYQVDWVPSMRQVIDLSDFDNSSWVNLTGASGHAFHANYDDQVQAWLTGEQYPWAFSRTAIDEAGTDLLTLLPG